MGGSLLANKSTSETNTREFRGKPIYVEIFIRSDMEELWRLTQDPRQHQRWDLRFTEITYEPRSSPDVPQKFSYVTRIGFGIKIEGFGESVGEIEQANGNRSSALKFWSHDRLSLISEGGGYWKYRPESDGIRFLTQYSYQVRYGLVGRWFDALIFRPLMGWATAWSFDRLRLCLEDGISPQISFQQTAIHALSRVSIAIVWIYHGLVPKLLYHHKDEVSMMLASGIPAHATSNLINAIGWIEVVFGLLIILLWRARWPFLISMMVMIIAMISVAVHSPQYVISAFNVITLNLLVIGMSVVGLLTSRGLPSAQNCLRKPVLKK